MTGIYLALALLLAVPGDGGAAPVSITSFDAEAGEHAENVAIDANGTVYVTLLGGGLYVRHPDGRETRLALGAGPGASATGLAIDRRGQLIVGIDRQGVGAKGVWRIDPATGASQQLFTLPDSVMVNGVAIDPAGRIYVADSRGGAIWRATKAGGTPHIWYKGAAIAPVARPAMAAPDAPVLSVGPNGLRWRNRTLYVSVSGQHRLIAIPVGAKGSAGRARTVISDLYIDDFGFDQAGRLIVTGDTIQLLTTEVIRIEADGRRTPLASGLQQPSAVAGDPRDGRIYVSILGLFGRPQTPSLITINLKVEAKDRQ